MDLAISLNGIGTGITEFESYTKQQDVGAGSWIFLDGFGIGFGNLVQMEWKWISGMEIF